MRWGIAWTTLITLATACAPSSQEFPGLRAFGNEPFWNVAITGDSIIYGRLGEEGVSYHMGPSDRTQVDSTGVVFGPVTDRTGQREIEVRVTYESCPDTMADVVHPMRATVIVDGEELSGCARWEDVSPGGERP